MTINETFFADGSQEYGEYEVCNTVGALARSGISVQDDGTMDFGMSLGSGKVTIASGGMAILNGMPFKPKVDKDVTIPTPSGNSRIDRIVLRRTVASHDCSVSRIVWTEASSPTVPDIARNDTYYDLSLYQILVTTTGSITLQKDERDDVTVCGAIRARDTSELDTYLKTIQANVEALSDLQAVSGGRAIKVSATEPTGVPAETLWAVTDTDGKITSVKVKQASGFWTEYPILIKESEVVADLGQRFSNELNAWNYKKLPGNCVIAFGGLRADSFPYDASCNGYKLKVNLPLNFKYTPNVLATPYYSAGFPRVSVMGVTPTTVTIGCDSNANGLWIQVVAFGEYA